MGDYGRIWNEGSVDNLWRDGQYTTLMANAFTKLPSRTFYCYKYKHQCDYDDKVNDAVFQGSIHKLHAFKKVYERLVWGEELITDEDGGIEMPDALIKMTKNEKTSTGDDDTTNEIDED